MKRLDTITLDFARHVIEDETGTPLEIGAAPASAVSQGASGGSAPAARLVARDPNKNPLISTFEWTADAAQRILRVPAGFMRDQTQQRIEELARERTATTIDLALVEDGIEIGKKMMAEMIANYPAPGKSPAAASTPAPQATPAKGNSYLNEVRRID